MRHCFALALAALVVLPANAQIEEPVAPAEFGEYAEGYTLYFEQDGKPAGSESFRADGEVTWRTPAGECFEGLWREYEGQMCFFYAGETDATCWQVLRDTEGFLVRRDGEDLPDLTYRVTGRDRRPLLCGAPGVRTSWPGR